MTTDWTVRGSNPVGAKFSGRPYRPWGPSSLLYNGYRVFPGSKVRPGRAAHHSPLLVPRSWMSRAILLPTLWTTTGPVTGTLYFCLSFFRSVILITLCFGTNFAVANVEGMWKCKPHRLVLTRPTLRVLFPPIRISRLTFSTQS